MAEPLAPRGEAHAARTGARPHPEIDWEAIERSPEFQELVHRRRSFVIPCTIFFLAWYMGFMVLTAYAPEFMGERVYEGLTVGYCLALTQFLMVMGLGLWYLRKSDRQFDPLAERAIEACAEDEMHPTGRRFTRERVGTTPASEVQR
jgi:uncharacterized membrane protein (DUF485 family)